MSFDDELHDRLGDLADSGGPWDDPLPAVLDRAAAHRRTTPATRRRWHQTPGARRLLGVAATVAVLAGGGVGLWQLVSTGATDTRSDSSGGAAVGGGQAAATSARPQPRAGHGGPSSCGPVPVSSGPAAGTATVSVRLLRSAAGEVTGVRPQLHLPAGAPAITATGSTRVVILAGARVVAARAAPPAAAGPTGAGLGSLPTAPLPATACPAGLSAAALPAGRYTVVVAVGYRPAAGGGTGVIVSKPLPITVR